MSKIRSVYPRDAKAIADIYNYYLVNSVATFDIETVTEVDMTAKIADISASYPFFVYELNGEIAGFCYAHEWKTKSAYQYTLETTIYLSPQLVGQGIGRRLMECLIEDCRARGYSVLIACITAENEASCLFHEKLGFRKVSHFEKVGMKFGRWLDVADYELIIR